MKLRKIFNEYLQNTYLGTYYIMPVKEACIHGLFIKPVREKAPFNLYLV